MEVGDHVLYIGGYTGDVLEIGPIPDGPYRGEPGVKLDWDRFDGDNIVRETTGDTGWIPQDQCGIARFCTECKKPFVRDDPKQEQCSSKCAVAAHNREDTAP
jgi:hypothetical protein